MDDTIIVDGLTRGDTNSFDDLVSVYEKRIYSFIYNMVHDKQTAEDLTQEAFIKVYKNLRRINDNFLLRPWLFKIAYNTTLNYIKKNRLKNICSIDENIPGSDYIGQYEIRHVILNGIKSLKPDCRAIFLLKIVEDLSFEQIAIILGMSTGAVKMKFYRNKKDLIDRLTESLREE